ncbi:MAG: hypothetical protein KJO07_07430, partial [Deltaproteobacteria bacterium]|nr:hypothetical protein [Deltaproteobacteria bacterium]
LRMATEAMLHSHKALQLLAEADAKEIRSLVAADHAVTRVPFLPQDVHDLTRLAALGRYLFVDK